MRIPLPIKITRMNNDWAECRSCRYADSGTCDFCEDADQYEEMDFDELLEREDRLAA